MLNKVAGAANLASMNDHGTKDDFAAKDSLY
jgi:hypothetical protein